MAIFTAKFQVTGSKRKELVNCISEALERPAKYLGAPTFSYQVDYITIDRNGTISFDDSANTEEIEHLSRNLISINTFYEMHLKSASTQMENIEKVNEQTRQMVAQIEELNRVYARMVEAMKVNSQMGAK